MLSIKRITKSREMKKMLIVVVVVLLALVYGCRKEDEPDYTTMIRGVWINTHVNDQPVLTDLAYVMEFRADFTEIYASGVVINDSNRTWIVNDQFTYTVKENRLLIDGENDEGNQFSMEFMIIRVDESTLRYTVNKFLVDNVLYTDTKTYTCTRVTKNLKPQFEGTWYGRSTTPGSDSSYHYWDYFADGTYDYYYQNSTSQWIKKQDNEGLYFLYGDYLASRYTNDLLSGAYGKAYECWNIRIEGNKMYWTGLRQGGITTSFEMERVAGPPG